MANTQAETREDVMMAPDLKQFLCEKTAAEFHVRWQKNHPKPPLGMIAGSLGIAIVLTFCGDVFAMAGQAFFFLAALQVLWAIVIIALRMSASTAEKRESILRGIFPKEAAPHAINRLRWWNHLVVPQNWARHSRIHDRKFKLEKHIQGLEKDIIEKEDAEEKNKELLNRLPNIDIATLAARINTWSQRVEYETRIAAAEEEVQRMYEELALYKALFHKVKIVTDKLERIEQLGIHFKGYTSEDINSLVDMSIAMLNERRQLVMQVDRIDPGEFLELIRVEQPRIAFLPQAEPKTDE